LFWCKKFKAALNDHVRKYIKLITGIKKNIQPKILYLFNFVKKLNKKKQIYIINYYYI